MIPKVPYCFSNPIIFPEDDGAKNPVMKDQRSGRPMDSGDVGIRMLWQAQ